MKEQTKFQIGRYKYPVTLIFEDDRIFVQFPYNKKIIAEIKSMEGAKWHGFDKPPRKIWSIKDSARNRFQLAYLEGKNPYTHFDVEIIKHDYKRPLFKHQKEFTDFILTRHYCLLAGEMGIGKTLAVIEVMERSGNEYWWYIAPKSALRAVERELRIWKSKIQPEFLTYEALTKRMKEWGDGDSAPRGVIFDESSRIKNPNAQRSQAAKMLADGVREDWGDDGYVILMSGAPAPKNPVDWWHQCEVACPGFIKEGTQSKFQKRLAIVTQQEFFGSGTTYPKLETWLDDERKCITCGKFEDEPEHDEAMAASLDLEYHKFQKSKNEVAYLYERMKGLVLVKLKKDCLDLPDKHYRIIKLEPSQKILNLAKSIVQTAPTTIGAITLLRELSDGFQYVEKEIGMEICPICKGKGKIENLFDTANPLQDKQIDCDGCGGLGKKKQFQRETRQMECPKESAIRDLLDEYIDVGRVVIYAAFTGAVNRCVKICKNNGWNIIRVDGRGWQSSFDDPLEIFQDQQEQYPYVAFIGQPGAGGMGLTLTASPVIIHYSNSFDAEHRIQSDERIHRPGMDYNRGATIIDLVHLPTDELILENLEKKRKLQSLSMGELQRALEK